jgi:hypothetical protein
VRADKILRSLVRIRQVGDFFIFFLITVVFDTTSVFKNSAD